MELTVVEAAHVPSKAVLALRTGSVRRQAKLELDQPFVIPHPGSESRDVEVSLFQQLASQTLPDDGMEQTSCTIPVMTSDGNVSQVTLGVRRGAPAAPSEDPTLSVPKAAIEKDFVGLTRDYLERHQLQRRIQSLVRDVLIEQPSDPYIFMLELLRNGRSGAGASSQPEGDEASRLAAMPASATSSPHAPVSASAPAPPPAPAQAQPPKPAQELAPKPPTGPKAPVSPKPAYIGRSYKPKTSCSKDEVPSSTVARCMLGLVLRMPECMKVAAESLRDAKRRSISKGMAVAILSSSRENVVIEAARLSSIRASASAAVRALYKKASVTLSEEYRAAARFSVCRLAVEGACRISSKSSIWSKIDLQDRATSTPSPIVALSAQSNWGAWTSRGSSCV
mmetsp:Transcript_99672/g.281352  ORF Transcript_99672/g.281352 Transcript_99672/m.281352 type:complete len:394 (-) Transcript_99672:191-1372(-)